MDDVANRWNQLFWPAYSTDCAQIIARAQALHSQSTRSPQEDDELYFLFRAFSGGFCIGGYLMNDRTPSAYEILYDPTMSAPGKCDRLKIGSTKFWGCPNLVNRLLYGIDEVLYSTIFKSDKWTGTGEDLYNLIVPFCLGQPFDLPIREAIDWVHASIYTTIKTMKFSHMAPICGGPVEIAVITTDRQFRWVRHKTFDSAIGEGFLYDVHHRTK
jgi:hypothetical protein